jgi:hypothetical protein
MLGSFLVARSPTRTVMDISCHHVLRCARSGKRYGRRWWSLFPERWRFDTQVIAIDHLGDMDCEMCGACNGVAAAQMDIKIEGLSRAILEQALQQAKRGRMFILGKMAEALPAPVGPNTA